MVYCWISKPAARLNEVWWLRSSFCESSRVSGDLCSSFWTSLYFPGKTPCPPSAPCAAFRTISLQRLPSTKDPFISSASNSPDHDEFEITGSSATVAASLYHQSPSKLTKAYLDVLTRQKQWVQTCKVRRLELHYTRQTHSIVLAFLLKLLKLVHGIH